MVAQLENLRGYLPADNQYITITSLNSILAKVKDEEAADQVQRVIRILDMGLNKLAITVLFIQTDAETANELRQRSKGDTGSNVQYIDRANLYTLLLNHAAAQIARPELLIANGGTAALITPGNFHYETAVTINRADVLQDGSLSIDFKLGIRQHAPDVTSQQPPESAFVEKQCLFQRQSGTTVFVTMPSLRPDKNAPVVLAVITAANCEATDFPPQLDQVCTTSFIQIDADTAAKLCQPSVAVKEGTAGHEVYRMLNSKQLDSLLGDRTRNFSTAQMTIVTGGTTTLTGPGRGCYDTATTITQAALQPDNTIALDAKVGIRYKQALLEMKLPVKPEFVEMPCHLQGKNGTTFLIPLPSLSDDKNAPVVLAVIRISIYNETGNEAGQFIAI